MFLFRFIISALELSAVVKKKLKARFFSILYRIEFSSIGNNFKLRGVDCIQSEGSLTVGDNCWVEAVVFYRGVSYTPRLILGDKVMLSDNVHVSCLNKIELGDCVLIGSRVYIGDHSHGTLDINSASFDLTVAPYARMLSDVSPIYIGKNTWIGDGAVILAGSYICDGCVVGANAVVKGEFRVPCVIAGVPAKAVKLLS